MTELSEKRPGAPVVRCTKSATASEWSTICAVIDMGCPEGGPTLTIVTFARGRVERRNGGAKSAKFSATTAPEAPSRSSIKSTQSLPLAAQPKEGSSATHGVQVLGSGAAASAHSVMDAPAPARGNATLREPASEVAPVARLSIVSAAVPESGELAKASSLRTKRRPSEETVINASRNRKRRSQ